MSHNLLNHPLLLQIIQRRPGQTAVDFQAIDEHGRRDEAVGLHVLLQLFRCAFVEDDCVVGFVLYYRSKGGTISLGCPFDMCGRVGVGVPFPLDHFFFCFLPPVAAGA